MSALYQLPAPYQQIVNDFIKKYQKSTDRFQELVQVAFNRATEINQKSGIDNIFCSILLREIWSVEQVKYMIDLGADPRYDNDRPLTTVASYPSADVAAYLIETFDAKINTKAIGDTFKYSGSLDTLRLFLDKGFRLEGMALDESIHKIEIVKVLIEKGYDINTILKSMARTERRYVRQVYPFVIEQLKKIDFQLDEEIINKLFWLLTDLHLKMTLDDVKVFINAGFNIKKNINECFYRLCTYDISIVRYLIEEYDVDINACDGGALANAMCVNNHEIINLLLDMGAEITDDHIDTALQRHTDTDTGKEVLHILYKRGIAEEHAAKIFMSRMFGNEPKEYVDIAKEFINNGIDFNKIILGMHKN